MLYLFIYSSLILYLSVKSYNFIGNLCFLSSLSFCYFYKWSPLFCCILEIVIPESSYSCHVGKAIYFCILPYFWLYVFVYITRIFLRKYRIVLKYRKNVLSCDWQIQILFQEMDDLTMTCVWVKCYFMAENNIIHASLCGHSYYFITI